MPGESTQDFLPPDPDSPTLLPVASDPSHETPTLLPGETTPLPPDGEVRLPPGYEYLGELGRGGMGVVFKARQKGLNRIVALKMILAGAYAAPEVRARFLAEAELLAKLHHPGIVQVYDFGTFEGRPYFAMEFVPDGSLDRRLNANPQSPRDAALLVEQLAEAMQAAHEAGIVHRDLKPGNILLAQKSEIRTLKSETNPKSERSKTHPPEVADFGASPLGFVSDLRVRISDFVPKVTDFGLAKSLEQETGNTRSGTIMGTPSYMAPEQAEGRKVTPATDVYALGALLYECLTGRPPFKAATPLDTVLQVIGEEPVPISRLQMRTPKDLVTICHKCLHKDPARRYASAAALAADLRAYRDDRPIAARPVGPWERAWRWCRRNPTVAGLAAALFVVLLASLVGMTVLYLRAEAQAAEALTQRDERSRTLAALQEEQRKADAARESERRTAYYQAVTGAHFAWQGNNLPQAHRLLAACPPELRGWEWHYLARLCAPERLLVSGTQTPVTRMPLVFSPNSRLFAVPRDFPPGILIGECATGNILRTVPREAGVPAHLAWHRDGQTLAVGIKDQVQLWNTATGERVRTLPIPGAAVLEVAFSPGGSYLAAGGYYPSKFQGWSPPGQRKGPETAPGMVRLWDVSVGKALVQEDSLRRVVSRVCFVDQGHRLVALLTHGAEIPLPGQPGGQLVQPAQWDTALGVKVWDLTADGARPRAEHLRDRLVEEAQIRLLPDGDAYISGGVRMRGLSGQDGVHDLLTGRQRHIFQAVDTRTLAVHPLGQLVAATNYARGVATFQMLTLWDKNGKEVASVPLDMATVNDVQFSPEGQQLALGGSDATVRLVDLRNRHIVRVFRGHTLPVLYLAYSPDGRWLASLDAMGQLRLWNTLHDPQAVHLPGHGSHISFPSARELLVIAGQFARTFDPATGRELTHMGQASLSVPWDALGYAYDPQGRWVAFYRRDKQEIERRDLRTGKPVAPLKPRRGRLAAGHANQGLASSHDGHFLAYRDYADTGVILWETATGKELWQKPGIRVRAWAFSADNRWLAALRDGEPLTLEVWDTDTGRVQHRWPTDFKEVNEVAYNADGTRLALVGHRAHGPVVQVWNAATGQPVLELSDAAGCVALSPDGRRIATGHPRSDAVQVWDARTGRLVLVLGGQREDAVRQLVFSPDSRFLVVRDAQNLVRVYSGAAGEAP